MRMRRKTNSVGRQECMNIDVCMTTFRVQVCACVSEPNIRVNVLKLSSNI